MDVSLNTLISTMQQDPKQAKEMLQSALQKNLMEHSADTNSSKMASKTILKNANTLLDSLFSKVIDGSTSKSEAIKTIQNSALFKQEQSATSDIKTLLTLAQKEPKLSRFIAPLQEFLKHVSTTDSKNLSTQIQNSGIGLEAKLAKMSSPATLNSATKQLISQFLQELQAQNSSTKSTQNILNELQNILNKKNIFKEDIQALQKSLNAFLSKLSTKTSSKDIQTLLQNIDKLETLLNKNNSKSNLAQIAKNSSALLNSLQNKTQLTTAQANELQGILKDIALLTKSLETKSLTTQEQQALTLMLISQNARALTQNSTTLNIQDQLKLLSLKFKQSMEILDKQSLHVNQNQKGIKQILNTLNTQTQNLPSKVLSENNLSFKAIEKDLKQTLLQLKDATSSSNSPTQKEINAITNKTLTQIQMHQLISYANSSINTYMPYTWEGLRDGSVAFKKGKDDSFYCQIDLELKMYGKVNMMLMLTNDRYINISIATEKDSLKTKINEHIKELKSALMSVGLQPLGVKMKPFTKSEYVAEEWSDFSMSLRV